MGVRSCPGYGSCCGHARGLRRPHTNTVLVIPNLRFPDRNTRPHGAPIAPRLMRPPVLRGQEWRFRMFVAGQELMDGVGC